MKLNRLRAIAIATLVLGLISVQVVGAQQPQQAQRGPSTPDERAKAVKIAHDLENDPLAKGADEQRDWVIRWIIDIPDITVDVCDEYFGKVPKPPTGHSKEITQQMVISMAAFMIEHPGDVKNEQAVALSGLLGSIKAYQAILKQDAASRWAEMDKLVVMRDQGKLDDFVADTRRKCAQEDEEPDPDTMHAQVLTQVR
jgi:hypothetical protein